jgi:hypothetical protein
MWAAFFAKKKLAKNLPLLLWRTCSRVKKNTPKKGRAVELIRVVTGLCAWCQLLPQF